MPRFDPQSTRSNHDHVHQRPLCSVFNGEDYIYRIGRFCIGEPAKPVFLRRRCVRSGQNDQSSTSAVNEWAFPTCEGVEHRTLMNFHYFGLYYSPGVASLKQAASNSSVAHVSHQFQYRI